MLAEPTLDDDQSKAVESDAVSLVVVAGAGCGKTEVVSRRVQRLLLTSTADPYRVLAISYTVRASDELRDRLYGRVGDQRSRIVADTIHGFAWTLLRQYGSRIGLPLEPEVLARDADRTDLLQRWLRTSGQPPVDDPIGALQRIDLARARDEDAPLLGEWKQALATSGTVDYPAMIDLARELVTDQWVGRHLHILLGHVVVDEAQNLTASQYDLITKLIGDPGEGHIPATLVGDGRQSIVTFAGADPTLMQRFETDYRAERIELRTNYRSARVLAQAADVVSQHLGHPTKAMGGTNFAARGVIYIKELPDEVAEATYVAQWVSGILEHGLPGGAASPTDPTQVQPEEIAVLARAASSLLPCRLALAQRSIDSAASSSEESWVASTVAKALVELVAFRSAKDRYFTRRHLEDLCGATTVTEDVATLLSSAADGDVRHLAALLDCPDVSSMMQSAAALPISDPDWRADWEQLFGAWLTFTERTDAAGLSFGGFQQHIARCQRGEPTTPGVRLRTVHKAQGQEFKAVAIVACNDRQFPDFRAKGKEASTAELRTFYVGVTRPSRALLLTRSMERLTRHGGPMVTVRSPFLELLGLKQA